MKKPNYNDRKVEERWCMEQREVVKKYLRSEQVKHGEVGEWPAWHIAPHVSIWAIESAIRPGWIGWWVISGDLPTDYISAAEVEPPQHPRKAVRAIAQRWLKQVDAWSEGQEYQGIRISGAHSPEELAPLLETRAKLLLDWTDDDSLWEEE